MDGWLPQERNISSDTGGLPYAGMSAVQVQAV